MKSTFYHVLGVMSGTSRDGIDLAEVEIKYATHSWSFSFGITETLEYSNHWRKTLAEADTYSPEKIQQLNKEYSIYLGERIKDFIEINQLKNLDAVCSHGHTVFHQPEKQYTLQIGNLPVLAKILNQKVVCDFRVQDVQFGGQGAPLVPVGDKLLFSEYAACINLGGFANISLEENAERIAYDICPVNIVLNSYAEECGFEYDDKGRIAASGKVDTELVKQLDQLKFYKTPPPKSLGIEWVRREVFTLMNSRNLTAEDILSTYTQHVVNQLALTLKNIPEGKVLLTGGGVYNDFLIQCLRKKTNCELIIPDPQLIEYKEALIFGLLGVLKLRGEINVLKSVTGAKQDHSSGEIFAT